MKVYWTEMASLQAHVTVWMLKWRLKPRLSRARDVAEARRLLTPPRFPIPKDVRLAPGESGGVPGEWAETSASGSVTLLYLHGGGYYACSAETHRPITTAFARRGFRVFAPNYRLAPEHPFPAAVDDAVAAYEALRAGDPGRNIVVAGESAGGGLTVALMLALRQKSQPLPAAAALFSPWTDLALTGDSVQTNSRRCSLFRSSTPGTAARWYLGSGDPRNPLASPLYADLAGLPPLLIHVGADEVLLNDSTRLASRARAAGVDCRLKIWPVVPHAWQLAQRIMPEARESVAEAAEFLRVEAS